MSAKTGLVHRTKQRSGAPELELDTYQGAPRLALLCAKLGLMHRSKQAARDRGEPNWHCLIVKIQRARKLTPAMAADIADKLRSIEDMIALVGASEIALVGASELKIWPYNRVAT